MEFHTLYEQECLDLAISKLNSNIIVEKAKDVYDNLKKLYDIGILSESKYINTITNNPILKMMYNNQVTHALDAFAYSKDYNKCRETHSVKRCTASVSASIAATIGMTLASTRLITTGITLPTPLNFVTIGSGIYIAEKTNYISKAVGNYVRDVNGVRLVKTKVKIFSSLVNSKIDDKCICYLTDSTTLKFPAFNILLVKEILSLFKKGIFEFKLDFQNAVFSSDLEQVEYDVLYTPDEISTTRFANIMYEADKTIKALMRIKITSENVNNESIDDIDIDISSLLPDFAYIDRAFAALFVLTSIEYDIYEIGEEKFLYFNNQTGINILTHTTDDHYSKLAENDKKEELLAKRTAFFKDWRDYIDSNFKQLMDKYHSLKDLYELSKALTIANILFQHNIEFKDNTILLSTNIGIERYKAKVDTQKVVIFGNNFELLTQKTGGVVLNIDKFQTYYTSFEDVIPDYKYGILSNIYNNNIDTQEAFTNRLEMWRNNYHDYIISEDERIVEFNEILKSDEVFHNEFFENVLNKLWCFTTKSFINVEDMIVDDESFELLYTKTIECDDDLLPFVDKIGLARYWYENYNSKFFNTLLRHFNRK